MSHSIESVWRTRGVRAWLLWPVSQLYRLLVAIRRLGFSHGVFKTATSSLPVIVVGNLVVGGTGKTPLTGYLVKEFRRLGWTPGIVSRGYGGQRHVLPHLLSGSDTAELVGDEPLMLSRQTGVPVCVCIKRAQAVSYLKNHSDCDIVFSDDGLQHLAMQRSAEVVVVDGERGFGNGWLLPAGPLREPLSQWRRAATVATQGDKLHASLAQIHEHDPHAPFDTQRFALQLSNTISLRDGCVASISEWRGKTVVAMAGIGHPMRFFNALSQAGLHVTGIEKPDHHAYTLDDFATIGQQAVLVTAKDAVKLRALGSLPVDVFEVTTQLVVSDALQASIVKLEAHLRHKKTILV